MSENQTKTKNPPLVPEKSKEAAKPLKKALKYDLDMMDSAAMFVMAFTAIGMKMDPLYMWGAWFGLLSLFINQGKTQTPIPQSLVSLIMCTFSIGLRYYQMHRGALPPPSK